MIVETILLLFGLLFLVLGANLLLEGAIKISKKFGWSKLFIGLTIVTLGTTTPELTINVISALNNNSSVGLGNILGSNIFNILVIIGFTGLFFEIQNKKDITKEALFSLGGILLVWIFSIFFLNEGENIISSFEGLLLIVMFCIFTYITLKGFVHKPIQVKHVFEGKVLESLLLGSFLLYTGGTFAVNNAVIIAKSFNISEFVIGATILAIGTSLPELTTSILAAIKKQQEISIGNIFGSTIFNTFVILGITAIISPISTAGYYKYFVFNAFAIILLMALLYTGRRGTLNKAEATILIISYLVIFAILILGL